MNGYHGTNGYLVHQDDADRWLWEQVREDLPRLRELEEKSEQEIPGAASLLRDLFAALFKARPVVLAPKTPNQRKRHKLLSGLMDAPDFARLRVKTRLRELEAALGAAEILPTLLESWPADDEPPPPAQPADPAGDQSQDALAARLRRLVRAANEKLDQVTAEFEAWGTAPGELTKLSLVDSAALAERLARSPELQAIARLAGRMKLLALSRYAVRVRHGTDELVGIEQGRALERVLPQELVLLRQKGLRREFFRRYAEGTLAQYQLSGREPLGRGPVIVCLDSSGSMKGDREAWAKAAALALLTVARRERRDFAVVHFGSESECQVFRFERGQGGPEAVLEALGFAFHGGTSFERPLREALGLIERSPYEKADVVFVTDGACQVSPAFLAEFLAAKKRREVRLLSVLIDADGKTSAATLESFSDAVYRLTDLARDEAVLEGLFTRP